MLRVAVPNKGALAAAATEMLGEAGYRKRHEQRDLTVLDTVNEVEFFFLRPKDIAIYVGSGDLDLGITGRDLALDSGAPVEELQALGFGGPTVPFPAPGRPGEERQALGFGGSTSRYAAPAGRDWKPADLHGKRLATSYPRLVRD